ncbi:MAG: polyprenyl synthetase family protein [Candidatus Bathyarchaeia archaeon]
MRKGSQKLIEQINRIFERYGRKAFEVAKNAILEEETIQLQVYKALQYFMDKSWYDVQHPALISLTCETVGGNPDKTINIGASIVLLAGAADLHDDVIDKSKVKDSNLTVFGKFGKDIAILAGDALLFKGLLLLHKSCEEFPKEQGEAILKLVKQAFFEIGSAEAVEVGYKVDKYNLTPEEYRRIIETKAAVAEACARIGAMLGGGSKKEIDVLGRYGRVLAILMTIRNEFIDIFEPDELRNRIKNECLPLPLLYALKSTKEKRGEIIRIIETGKITEKTSQHLVELINCMDEIQRLKDEMHSLVKETANSLKPIKRNRTTLKLLLQSTLEDL